MARFRLMILALTTLVVTLFAVPAFAQCTDPDGGGTVADGESPPDAPCLICRGTTLEPLPVHTVCGEDRFECRNDGVYRDECTDQSGEIECAEVNRAPNCPGGHVCGEGDPSYCLRSCTGDSECRDGFECDLDSESCIPLPMPDMGGDGEDMGGGEEDMGMPPADAGGSDGGSVEDAAGDDGGQDGGNSDPVIESGGCSSVPPSPSPLAFVLAAFAALIFTRRTRSR